MKNQLLRAIPIAFALVWFVVDSWASAPTAQPLPNEAYTNTEDSVYLVVDQMPEFQGGRKGLATFIQQNLKYPEAVPKDQARGKVYVKFIVDVTGKVRDISLVRRGNQLFDNEALRIVRMMPSWKPGVHKGQPVNVTQIVTISFAPPQ